MWPFGKKAKQEALREEGRKQIRLEQKYEAEREKEIIAYKEKEQSKVDRYFALKVYPSGRDCWACGNDSPFEGRKVELTADGTKNGWGSLTGDLYGGRRYLKVTCERCSAALYERFIASEVPNEIAPEKVVNPEGADSDSKVKEREGE